VAVLFDTLKLADRLEAAGMPARQAHDMAAALAETITGDLVTREHLDLRLGEMETRLRGEIAAAELRLRAEITGVRAEITGVRGEIAAAELRLRAEITGVRGEIASLRGELIKWVVGAAAAAALPIIGLLVPILIKVLH
jgi:hypothetical protein